MLSCREHQAWFLNLDQTKDYRTEAERRFFEDIRNPPEPTQELKDLVREYGYILRKD